MHSLKTIEKDRLLELGLSENPTVGDLILPNKIGNITNFNTNGKERILKDREKIRVEREVSRSSPYPLTYTRAFWVRQREKIAAPKESISVVDGYDGLQLSSRILTYNADGSSDNEIVHVINLFLEMFGNTEIAHVDPKSPPSLYVKRFSKLLPQGEFPFERIKEEWRSRKETKTSTQDIDFRISKLEKIEQYKPNVFAYGEGEFNGYVVLGFREKNVYILESPLFGNATYVLEDDWENISQLTKAEIIQNSYYKHRVIHDSSWDEHIDVILKDMTNENT